MKRHLYGIIIVFLLVMPTLKADITTLEEAIELIKHLEDIKYNATALNELKDYILNDDSLTQDEIEILLEKVAIWMRSLPPMALRQTGLWSKRVRN